MMKTKPLQKPVAIWDETFEHKRRMCVLMITHDCNLNCSYCYESHKSKKTMSVDMAKSLILREAERVRTDPMFEELQVDFLGGEPFMNFPLIREIVEWLDANPLPVPFICFGSTNGTLLDDDRKNWLRKYKDLVCFSASYDGSTEMQRTNRGTTQGSVDLEFFHELWPTQGFQMTISKETLPHLAEGILESQRKGYPLFVALAQGVDWNAEDARLYFEQLQVLKEAYLDDETLTPINRLTRYLLIDSTTDRPQTKTCGTGTHMVTYDVDGKAYGCHLFTPIVLGPESGLELSRVDWQCDEIAQDERCSECVLKSWCSTCAGFNYRYRGSLAKRDMRWCSMMLMEAVVSCELQIQLLNKRRNELSASDAEHAQHALTAYRTLTKIDVFKTASPFKSH